MILSVAAAHSQGGRYYENPVPRYNRWMCAFVCSQVELCNVLLKKKIYFYFFLLYFGCKDNLCCIVFTYITVVLYQAEIE